MKKRRKEVEVIMKRRRFEKGDRVDVVEMNEDGLDLWPWRRWKEKIL